MSVGVLGPMVATVEGRRVSLGGLRQRAVLAVLVAARGRAVSEERILADVWGDGAPAAGTLRSYVSVLRRILEPGRVAGGPAQVISREGNGYCLRGDAAEIDAEIFGELVERGEGLLRGGEPAAALPVLNEALALWRGDPYGEFGEMAFAVPEKVRLDGLRLAAAERLFEARLALGGHSALIGDLEKHTLEHPLSERGWELLATALYRSGRQGDALGALRGARRVLADELGIDPGPALRRLEAAIFAQEEHIGDEPVLPPQQSHPTSKPPIPSRQEPQEDEHVTSKQVPEGSEHVPSGQEPEGSEHVPSRQETARGEHVPYGRGEREVSDEWGPAGRDGSAGQKGAGGGAAGRNLPHALSRFVGRTAEPEGVNALLAGHRLVTLTGPGGIGKTRLALEAARGRPDGDGPWLVELAELEDPSLLVVTLAGVLGIAGATSAERLGEILGDREVLLVLDNCEHLVEVVRDAVRTLLTRAGGLRVLATSREALNLPGEVVYEVRPLPVEQGRDLFLSRAAASVPGWSPDAVEERTIRRLCHELDGLPLAIELAAAQCRVLSVEQIASGLDDRFAVLRDGSGPGRHQTLWRTVEWSHDLLSPAERQVLHRLGVFASGFDLDAAVAVCGRPVFAELSALVRKSLVSVEAGTTPRRYRLLETIKEFTRARTDPGAQAAHRAWVLAEAEAAAPLLRGPRSGATVLRLTAQQPEHRVALTSALLIGDGDYALRLSGLLSWFWYGQGIVAEGLGWINAAIELSPSAGPELTGPAFLSRSRLAYLAGDFAGARDAAGAAIQAARTLADVETEAQAVLHRALFDALCGDTGFLDLAGSGLDQARSLGLPWLECEALMIVGMLLRFAGLVAQARETLVESAAIAESCGYVFILSSDLWLIMKIDLDLGAYDRALEGGLDMLLRLDENGDVTSWLVAVHGVAAALAMTGSPTEGAMLLGAVAHHGARVGFSPAEMDPLDVPRQARQVRDALSPDEFDTWFAKGSALTRPQIRSLAESWQRTRTT